jgi:hypothetical protein
MAQMVEHLPSKHQALSSNPAPFKKKKRERRCRNQNHLFEDHRAEKTYMTHPPETAASETPNRGLSVRLVSVWFMLLALPESA